MRRGDDPFVAVCARAALRQAGVARRLLGPVRRGRSGGTIHDLRVASRRLRAALALLAAAGVRKARRWRRRARRLTRALGDARDLDVRLAALDAFRRRSARSGAAAGLARLQSRLRSRRAEAQRAVNRAVRRLRDDGTLPAVARWAGRRASAAAASSDPGARAFASRRIRKRLGAFLALAPAVFREGAADDHHRLRIAAKRLRYTLETLRPILGREAARPIADARALQEILGDLHDCDVWLAALPAAAGDGTGAFRQDRARHRRALYRRLAAAFRRRAPAWDAFRRTAGAVDDAPATLAVIGDVHANRQALAAVLADIDRRGIREILCAGDVVGYGAAPREVVALLRRRKIPGIAGNLDRKLFRVAGTGAARDRGPVSLKRLTHRWTWGQLAPADRAWLRALPGSIRLRRGGHDILLVHGSPASDEEYLSPETPRKRLRELARAARADVVVAGHAHVPFVGRARKTGFVNVGSVGRPEDRPTQACYAILDLAPGRLRVRHVRVPYDVAGAVADVRRAGLPEPYARMILTGRQLAGVSLLYT